MVFSQMIQVYKGLSQMLVQHKQQIDFADKIRHFISMEILILEDLQQDFLYAQEQ